MRLSEKYQRSWVMARAGMVFGAACRVGETGADQSCIRDNRLGIRPMALDAVRRYNVR